MSQVLANIAKTHAAAGAQQMAEPRWGLVAAYDDTTGNVKVLVQPEGVLSGWIPVLYPCVGNGWGIVAPPPHNAMVKLIHEHGDGDFPVVVGCAYNKQDVQPQPLNAFGGAATSIKQGEMALVSESGAVIRLCADKTLYIAGASVQIDCDLHVNGDVYDKHGSLDRLRGNFNTHRHGGVQQGGSTTSTTTSIDPE